MKQGLVPEYNYSFAPRIESRDRQKSIEYNNVDGYLALCMEYESTFAEFASYQKYSRQLMQPKNSLEHPQESTDGLRD